MRTKGLAQDSVPGTVVQVPGGIVFVFFLFLKKHLLIYLAVPSLNFAHGILDLHRSTGTLSCGMWDLVPNQGLNLDPCIESAVLATGPPGKFPET